MSTMTSADRIERLMFKIEELQNSKRFKKYFDANSNVQHEMNEAKKHLKYAMESAK